MDDFSEAQTNHDDEALIGWLNQAAGGASGDTFQALAALAAFPESFWSVERIVGALSALAPIAATEPDDELAFALWNLFATLLARYLERRPSEDEVEFEEIMVDLLAAASPEIRGFAATALAGLGNVGVGRELALALSEEVEWDVAMRMIAALGAIGASLDATTAIRVLDAPAEEAVIYGIDQIGEFLHLNGWRALHHMVTDPHHRRSDEIRGEARWALDRLAAADFRLALTEKLPDHLVEQTALREEKLSATLFGNSDLELTVAVVLPGSTSLNDVPEARLHIGWVAREPPVLPVLDRIARVLVGVAGPGRGELAHNEEHTVDLTIALGPRPRATFERVMSVLDAAVTELERTTLRSNKTHVEEVDVTPLERATGRIDAVRSANPDLIVVDGADRTRYAMLASASHLDADGDPVLGYGIGHDTTAVLNQQKGWVLGLTVGSGVCEDKETVAAICGGFADLLQWKFNLEATRIDPDSEVDPSLAHVWGAEPASTTTYALTFTETDGDSVSWIADVGRRLDTFLGRAARLMASGADPFEVVGLPGEMPRTELAIEEDEPTIEVSAEEIVAAHHETLVDIQPVSIIPFPGASLVGTDTEVTGEGTELTSAAEMESSWTEAITTQVWIPVRAPEDNGDSPDLVDVIDRSPTLQDLPAVRPPQAREASVTPAAVPGAVRSPSEIVRSLSDHVEVVDVFLRSVGHNTAKLAQIMTILLQMEPGDAQDLISRAPCMLREAIPRDRSRTIKTVLQGTGAKITVTPHGEEPPPLVED